MSSGTLYHEMWWNVEKSSFDCICFTLYYKQVSPQYSRRNAGHSIVE